MFDHVVVVVGVVTKAIGQEVSVQEVVVHPNQREGLQAMDRRQEHDRHDMDAGGGDNHRF